jgi:hypothetical protein
VTAQRFSPDHGCLVDPLDRLVTMALAADGLVMLPLAPLRDVAWAAGKVADAAIQQLHSPTALPAQLGEPGLRLETGTIGDSEFDQAEGEILGRLSLGGLAGRDARL